MSIRGETALRKIEDTYSEFLCKYIELTKCNLSKEDSKKYIKHINKCFRQLDKE